jgi:hypothetical protein
MIFFKAFCHRLFPKESISTFENDIIIFTKIYRTRSRSCKNKWMCNKNRIRSSSSIVLFFSNIFIVNKADWLSCPAVQFVRRWPYVTVGLKSAIWTPDVAVNLWTHGQGNENEKNLHWAAPRPVCVSLSLCMSYQQNRNLSCCFFRLILDCQRKEKKKKTLFPFLNIENKK